MIGSKRPLRILHIILGLKPPNGQYNEHCLPMRHEREITICTYFKSIFGVTPPPEISLFDGDDTLIGFFHSLRSALEGKEFDVIHVHTPHASALLPMTLFLSGLYRKLKSSTVHTIQNSYHNFQFRHKLMFIPGFIFNQRLVFCSQVAYDSFPKFYKLLAGNRTYIVQNAADLDRIDRVAETEEIKKSDQFTVVTVGLIPMKNPFTVLEAFHQLPDPSSRLVYLGEGNLRQKLESKIAELDILDRVKLAGMIARDSAIKSYWSADVFISASWGEGLPVAILEAMASQCPVILSDIPPHREIAQGVDFIPLIKPGDVSGFAKEMVKYFEMSSAEREAIGMKCRKLVEDRFSLPVMHAGYEEVYAQVINHHAPSLSGT